MLHFFDEHGRFIGKRERKPGEAVPHYATETPLELPSGHEAFFIGGAWQIREMVQEPTSTPPEPLTPEEQIEELQVEVALLIEIMEALI